MLLGMISAVVWLFVEGGEWVMRTSKRKNLDTLVVFRWRADRERALRDFAESQKGVSLTTHIRALLDNYCVRLGIVK